MEKEYQNCDENSVETSIEKTDKSVSDNQVNGNRNNMKKPVTILVATALLAGICYSARQQLPTIRTQVNSVFKTNPVSGNKIVAVNKPLYVIKEDDFAYTNIQWAEALSPEFAEYIPKDITLVEPFPNDNVKIDGNAVTFDLAPLAGVTPVVFSNIGNGKITPADVPDEEIEVVYSYRDGIKLKGTITDYGTAKEISPDSHIYHGRHSGDYDKNVFTNATVYYLNGTIDSVQNTTKAKSGFSSGYTETVYNHDGMYISMKKEHGNLYTYPGVVEKGKINTYNDKDEWTGSYDVEYQVFSRFQILYFPDEDLYQVEIILVDQGTVDAEGEDGKGRHEKESTDTDHIYQITMLSDYKMFRSVDEWHEYVGDNYVIVKQ